MTAAALNGRGFGFLIFAYAVLSILLLVQWISGRLFLTDRKGPCRTGERLIRFEPGTYEVFREKGRSIQYGLRDLRTDEYILMRVSRLPREGEAFSLYVRPCSGKEFINIARSYGRTDIVKCRLCAVGIGYSSMRTTFYDRLTLISFLAVSAMPPVFLFLCLSGLAGPERLAGTISAFFMGWLSYFTGNIRRTDRLDLLMSLTFLALECIFLLFGVLI